MVGKGCFNEKRSNKRRLFTMSLRMHCVLRVACCALSGCVRPIISLFFLPPSPPVLQSLVLPSLRVRANLASSPLTYLVCLRVCGSW